MSVAAQRLRVTAIGIGYLGLTHAACMAELGHDVLAIDTDQERVARVSAGEMPFFEPELEELMRKGLESGRLRFTTSYEEIGEFGEVHFLCVGTPQGADGAADLSQVNGAVDALAPYLRSACLIVGKSTVPVGTARKLTDRIHAAAPAGADVELAWNPEFLREGNAVQDTLRPDRLVFGVTSERADSRLRQVYEQPLADGIPALTMGLETAELVKVSANSFLATKISFINAVADTCEAAGADVTQLVEALALDERIGRKSMSPGLGFGGGCLPKDIRAYQARAKSLGADSIVSLLSTVDDINKSRRVRVVDMAREVAGGSLSGKRIAALGVAFKPNSDDIRDSPSLDVCGRLAAEGAIVTAHDPMALENASRVRPELRYATSVLEAAEDADLVLHLTEWTEYRSIDPSALAEVVAQRNVIDARCVLDTQAWQAAGWSVRALGRAVL
jgi:UDPglucose 6-dehydrogenase